MLPAADENKNPDPPSPDKDGDSSLPSHPERLFSPEPFFFSAAVSPQNKDNLLQKTDAPAVALLYLLSGSYFSEKTWESGNLPFSASPAL